MFFQIQKGGIRMQEWVAYFSYFNDTITFHLTSVQLEKIERLCVDYGRGGSEFRDAHEGTAAHQRHTRQTQRTQLNFSLLTVGSRK